MKDFFKSFLGLNIFSKNDTDKAVKALDIKSIVKL